uniref:Uncharacterized protein n=1 Tax=Caenorhabditis japonica TaxID=281687 RepID=A0A8R1ITH5_CAEJA
MPPPNRQNDGTVPGVSLGAKNGEKQGERERKNEKEYGNDLLDIFQDSVPLVNKMFSNVEFSKVLFDRGAQICIY